MYRTYHRRLYVVDLNLQDIIHPFSDKYVADKPLYWRNRQLVSTSKRSKRYYNTTEGAIKKKKIDVYHDVVVRNNFFYPIFCERIRIGSPISHFFYFQHPFLRCSPSSPFPQSPCSTIYIYPLLKERTVRSHNRENISSQTGREK